MVLASSHRILVSCATLVPFKETSISVTGLLPCFVQLSSHLHLSSFLFYDTPKPQRYFYPWFGLLQFRSPLLPQSFVYFLFLRLLRCFSSAGSPHYTMDSCNDNTVLMVLCFHIRTSTGRRLCASIRRLSQLITSFIGAYCQGIPYMLFVA